MTKRKQSGRKRLSGEALAGPARTREGERAFRLSGEILDTRDRRHGEQEE
jgi:hypothetical protein